MRIPDDRRPTTDDRAAGDAWAATFPGVREIARASRTFLTRSIQYLAQDAGIRQFLDVGTGLPEAGSKISC
jgi:S-adenosyl methyltransferase